MGRHSSSGTRAVREDASGRLARVGQRLALAVVGGVTTALAVAWAGNTWASAWGAGAAAGVVVLGAAVLASTVPPPPERGPDEPRQADPASPAADAAGRPSGHDPVQ